MPNSDLIEARYVGSFPVIFPGQGRIEPGGTVKVRPHDLARADLEPAVDTSDLASLTVAQLRTLAKAEGIDLGGAKTKAAIVSAIQAAPSAAPTTEETD